jgi:hypothetical protein
MTSRLSSKHAVPWRLGWTLGFVTALGALAWSGCGPGSETRYYCDATGCFTCDAYGCSNVSAPPPQSCTGNASCPAGSVCTSLGCSFSCQSDATCAKGEICKSGLCMAPGAEPGTPKECTTKTDCKDGKTCISGSCQACGGTAGPCPCQTAADCDGGKACVAGACTATENACKYSSECGDGKLCADGQCLASCETTTCGTGFSCDKGVCKPTPSGACTTDAQCGGATPNCLAGTCGKACAADPECGDGNYCNQGACAVDTRPKPNCTTDAQCGGTAATPKKCLGGFCKYTCATDQYCRTIDSRIGYCAKDGVCRDATEANASCVQSSDCGGKTCIDNQCR